MLNFNFLEKSLALVSLPHFAHDFSIKMFLTLHSDVTTDQISLSNCPYFSRYWAIFVLQLFVDQAVTSQNLKLT